MESPVTFLTLATAVRFFVTATAELKVAAQLFLPIKL